ncbi:hypothetical protein MIR68_000319 [Amoeboaphelidium protococcarum]|nr:hypothetical protein MIR68_000319 [Amoeboaphelidium protococcarum]
MILAICSGFMAALSSVFAKMTLSAQTLEYLRVIVGYFGYIDVQELAGVERYAKFISSALVILCNVLMWAIFTKALAKSKSAVSATVINTASNFCFSALLGHLFFNESLNAQWWGGCSMIIAGCVLINFDISKGAVKQD